jgi:hypothetical protein
VLLGTLFVHSYHVLLYYMVHIAEDSILFFILMFYISSIYHFRSVFARGLRATEFVFVVCLYFIHATKCVPDGCKISQEKTNPLWIVHTGDERLFH